MDLDTRQIGVATSAVLSAVMQIDLNEVVMRFVR